jgi:hypothetical protein
MEGRQNVWSPWYLMPKDKPRKVECKFCDNVISYCKDKMQLHLGYRYDGYARIGVVMCSKTHPQAKGLFAQCGGLIPPPLNNMETQAHIPDGLTKDVTIETSNPLVEKKFA